MSLELGPGLSPMRMNKMLLTIPALGALGIVLALNFLLRLSDPVGKVDPESLPAARTWAWWAATDYKQQDPPPNVVLLGSSVVMQGSWFAESDYRHRDVELIVDHNSDCLESIIEKKVPGIRPRCFNFALPGSMASDMCMVAKAMFTGERTPDIAVIGLHPRDFFDNTFHTPAGTKHYRYMARFTDTQGLTDMAIPSLWDRVRFFAQEASYFTWRAKELQIIAGESLRKVLSPWLNTLRPSPLDSVKEEDRRFALFQHELNRGLWIAHPDTPWLYIDSAFDCKRRLGKPYKEMFENQKQWLKLCLETCKQRGITPMLVVMPVSDVARQFMAPGTYERHVSMVKDFSKEFNCDFVNTNDESKFVVQDFTDWAHLGSSGGRKALETIGNAIASDKQMVARLAGDKRGIAASPGNNL